MYTYITTNKLYSDETNHNILFFNILAYTCKLCQLSISIGLRFVGRTTATVTYNNDNIYIMELC